MLSSMNRKNGSARYSPGERYCVYFKNCINKIQLRRYASNHACYLLCDDRLPASLFCDATRLLSASRRTNCERINSNGMDQMDAVEEGNNMMGQLGIVRIPSFRFSTLNECYLVIFAAKFCKLISHGTAQSLI